jgi:hypothetical protein
MQQRTAAIEKTAAGRETADCLLTPLFNKSIVPKFKRGNGGFLP